jgi:long-chain acyl-CoA synthetase
VEGDDPVYPASIAAIRPHAIAYVMADSGRSLTYQELDERSNQLAHLLRKRGIGPGGTLILVAENRIEWPVIVAAGMRAGLYVTPVNWHLSDVELRRVLAEALAEGGPAVIVASAACAEAVLAALGDVPARDGLSALCLDEATGSLESFAEAVSDQPRIPIENEEVGARVLYSGGTTGRPRAYRQRLLGVHPLAAPPRHSELTAKLGLNPDAVFLSPAPNYHAAPFTFQMIVLGLGGTVVCMERFDPEGALAAIERHRVSHSQWVPTMLLRLLRLDADQRARYDLSSHRVAFTSGAPCAAELKAGVMAWWGPTLHEYYGSSEGYGHTYVSPEEALAHPGTVGRPLGGTVHIAAADGTELPPRTVGKVWFGSSTGFYTNTGDDPNKVHPKGWRSVGDLGYLDEGGFLYLVGRESHTIISGGVNIYPTEIEEVLLTHPAVADVAVIGVPDAEFGEQVKAVVEIRGQVDAEALEAELIELCRARLARYKAPRSVDFAARIPRTPAGKLNKNLLRAPYWLNDKDDV